MSWAASSQVGPEVAGRVCIDFNCVVRTVSSLGTCNAPPLLDAACHTENGQLPIDGIDSLAAVELSSSLTTTFGLRRENTMVFDYPTVDAMSHHIFDMLSPTATQTRNTAAITLAGAWGELASQRDVAYLVESSRLPEGDCSSSMCIDKDVDAIFRMPHDRWDLEPLRVIHRTICGAPLVKLNAPLYRPLVARTCRGDERSFECALAPT